MFVNGYGVWLDASEATISNSELSANGFASHEFDPYGGPIVAINGSQAEITDSTMMSNQDGPFSIYNSRLIIRRCTMGNGLGPQAIFNSRTTVSASTVNGGTDFAEQHSLLAYTDSTITNMFDSYANRSSILHYTRSSVQTRSLAAFASSRLELRGSTLVSTPCPPAVCEPEEEDPPVLFLDSHSLADVQRRGVQSNITGHVLLSRFSDGWFETDAPITGRVECSHRSRVFTNQPPAGGTSGCE